MAVRSLRYPCITNKEFTELVAELGITLAPDLLQEQYKQAARSDAELKGYKIHGQQANELNRHEFIECLVRIAFLQYKQQPSKKGESVTEAF